MLINLQKFLETERPGWEELERLLERLESSDRQMEMQDILRFHYLYEKVSSDLARISTFTSEQQTRRYLESLVARAYGEIHEIRRTPHQIHPLRWFLLTFPRTFRRHIRPFYLSTAITLLGAIFGSLVLLFDPGSRDIVVPGFDHLVRRPSERVQMEEKERGRHLAGQKTHGAAWYMTHNTQVAINTMVLGITYGVGTAAMLFATGIMVGSIAVDYIVDGQAKFLVAWLLPHGSVEIPALLLAGQAGFVLAGALIGWGRRVPLRQRFRRISTDLTTLIFGVAIFLVWAGIIEAFLSQYHEPVIPYWCKIAFGIAQLFLVVTFLGFSGRAGQDEKSTPIPDPNPADTPTPSWGRDDTSL